MKIKQEIIQLLTNVKARRRISEVLDISDQTCYLYLRANNDDSDLTKLIVLREISKITGLPIEAIIEDGVIEEEMIDSKIVIQK